MPRMTALLALFALSVGIARADAPVERRLYADLVAASSFLWNDWNKFQENYHPAYVMDDDPATAWVEGASDAGEGEWLRLDLAHLEGATNLRLRVRNGYQKSETLFKANARPKDVTITLLPGGVSTKATLGDALGWQEIVAAQPAGELHAVMIKVDSVYPGTKYTDLAISDLEVYATALTRDNPVAEKARLDRLLAWKQDRLAAAAFFKAASAGTVPVAPSYTLKAVKGPAVPDLTHEPGWGDTVTILSTLAQWPAEPNLPRPDGEIAVAVSAFSTDFAGWTPVQAVPKDTRSMPAVDGLGAASLWSCFDGPPVWGNDETGEAGGTVELPAPGKLGFLRADNVGTFASAKAPSLAAALRAEPSACSSEKGTTFAWAKTSAATASQPAQLEALLLVTCGTVEAREGKERVAVPQLLVYDDHGLLTLLVGRHSATSFGWRTGAAGAVLSQALRVGAWTSAVRLSEGAAAP